MNSELAKLVLSKEEFSFMSGVANGTIKLVFGDMLQKETLARIESKLNVQKEVIEEEIRQLEEQMSEIDSEIQRRLSVLKLL